MYTLRTTFWEKWGNIEITWHAHQAQIDVKKLEDPKNYDIWKEQNLLRLRKEEKLKLRRWWARITKINEKCHALTKKIYHQQEAEYNRNKSKYDANDINLMLLMQGPLL